jgi:hypothetical protein
MSFDFLGDQFPAIALKVTWNTIIEKHEYMKNYKGTKKDQDVHKKNYNKNRDD